MFLLGGVGPVALLFFAALHSDLPREQVHKEVAKELQGLHFFYEGRGMTLSPDFVNTYRFLAKWLDLSKPIESKPNLASQKKDFMSFQKRWGMIDHDGQIKGFFHVDYKGLDVGVLGCAACHSGKAAGIYIPGLGNKNIDPAQVGSDAYRALQLWKKANFLKKKSADYKMIEALSIDFARRLSNSKYSNLTQGMVPVALIQEWFYKNAGRTLPDGMARGAVKVPHFWGYSKKRFVGQFADGFGDGAHPGWGLLVELTGGQTAEGARAMMKKVSHVEDRIGELLPPKYPFAIDLAQAERGKMIFETNCSGCHGTYQRDKDGLAVYEEPKLIPWTVVKTDFERLSVVTEDFMKLVDSNPLNDEVRVHRRSSPGYFAPRLDGVWSRFPYLHNASIPNIRALLTDPSARPRVWSMVDAGERSRFDEDNLGLKIEDENSKDLQKKASNGSRNVYSTSRDGHSNAGHWFAFSPTLSDADKTQLIEYLKSL